MRIEERQRYDAKYRDQNYFRYREWLHAPYVSSLIAFCGLKQGSSVLDVGCGQGFFSYLFNKHGMRVLGVDLSETGIRIAESLYGQLGITFTVSDVEAAAFPEKFDCVFVRSCSLYNNGAFPGDGEVTTKLLRHLKDGGVFIFVYNSNFSSKTSSTWRYHSLRDVQQHFSASPWNGASCATCVPVGEAYRALRLKDTGRQLGRFATSLSCSSRVTIKL